MTTTTHVPTIDLSVALVIQAAPEAVWDALVDGAVTPAYYVGFRAEFDLVPGRPYRYTAGGGDVITGTVLDVEPGRSLTTTFHGLWDPEVAELPESVVTFRLEEPTMPVPGLVQLTCTHTGLPDVPVARSLEAGWVTILSGLKTLLETGRPMGAAQ